MPFKDPDKRREYRRKWYYKNKESELDHIKKRKIKIRKWFEKFKLGLKCSKCNEDHPATLDFHHKNNKQKDFAIGKMVSEGYSINRVKEELMKCIVLCSNCHRKIHYKNI
ncbi:hypothetical protein GOV12_01090 [Candidatus Pacearchaeota archaeon]|nr:hypothetical protein [Candidatus Pacearchaeota archaeon]